MFTENGVMIDMEELRKVVEHCDVFTIGFRLFPERLIVDARTSEQEGPMIEIVEPVSTVEERFFWLGKRRPSFGVPEQFTFFIWPHSVRFLSESGLAERARQRIAATQAPEAVQAVDTALAELERRDYQATLDAIIGKNYHTLWARG